MNRARLRSRVCRRSHLAWRNYQKKVTGFAAALLKATNFFLKHPRKAILKTIEEWAVLARLSQGLTRLSSGQARPKLNRVTVAQARNVSLSEHVSESPQVTVIIPVYGKTEITRRCLASIASNPPKCTFEVLVVDDCTPNDSASELTAIPGVRVIRHAHNIGFLRSCNEAAKQARGLYLCFLNNDTEVTAGWLDALLRTFDEFPGCGLAGSKLLNVDGTLQEAGGIVWQNGSATNFGRGEHPLHCTYNYAREVDYCSGASIMVPANLFTELEGFDDRYAPAYYEDTDLAFRLREKGYRVIYQPLSEVLHLDGATSGRDTATGIKAYQVINMEKFYDRWRTTLRTHELPGEFVDTAKDRGQLGRVLIIDHCIPMPDRDSGSMDVYNLMLVLRDSGYQVTFASNDDLRFDEKYTRATQRVGVEVLHKPFINSVKSHLAAHGSRYNLVILMRPQVMEAHIDAVRQLCPSAKVIFHTIDLHFIRMARQASVERSQDLSNDAERMRMLELKLIDRADIATVVSERELVVLRDTYNKPNVRLLPFARHIRGTQKPFSQRSGAVFVGGFRHQPNIDAVLWLVNEIMPLVWRVAPEFDIHVVGPDAPLSVIRLAGDRVVVHGFIADLDTFLDKRRISLAPLRYGAGIKGKVGHAMSMGIPTVATSIAVEGMSLAAGDGVIIADSPDEFASAMLRVDGEAERWNSLSLESIRKAKTLWGVETCQSRVKALLSELGLDIPATSKKTKLFTNPL